MIYLSAQPDNIYFLWQLKIQFFNFIRNGILPQYIHILIGYNNRINPLFEEWGKKSGAKLFFYPDTRKNRLYAPSIRPHLIAKHLIAHPELEKETLFYHDSDILLTQKPEWGELEKGDCWYASDTSNYLNSQYIRQHMSEFEFESMCKQLDVTPEKIRKYDSSAGGAQYILKHSTATFWNEIEINCEKLYSYLHRKQHHSQCISKKFQIWCTDMWVIWWTCIKNQQPFNSHPLLNFCWADSPIKMLDKTIILHYTGGNNSKRFFFDKLQYQVYEPFYADLSYVDTETCSFLVVKTILDYKKILEKNKLSLQNLQLFIVCPPSEIKNTKAQITLKYLSRYFKGKILMGKYDNYSLKKKSHLCCIPAGYIFRPTDILFLEKIAKINPKTNIIISIKVFQSDSLGKHIFNKLLDYKYFEENSGKALKKKEHNQLILQSNITNPTIMKQNITIKAYEI